MPHGDDLSLFEFAGLVDADFLALTDNISTNGWFYSFVLATTSAGSGPVIAELSTFADFRSVLAVGAITRRQKRSDR